VQAGEVLLKDSMHCFKFWASGRRFCQARMPQHGAAAAAAAAAAMMPFLSPIPIRLSR
jgi:hypothetical protein